MLSSMGANPRPTRAEMTDVANAVFESADALMLGDETANGQFPAQAVAIMASIIANAEEATNYYAVHSFVRDMAAKPFTALEGACSSLARSAMDAAVCAVLTVTESGEAAEIVAKYRPSVPHLVVTSSAALAASFSLYFGAVGVHWDGASAEGADVSGALAAATRVAHARGLQLQGHVSVLHGRDSLAADDEGVLTIVACE